MKAHDWDDELIGSHRKFMRAAGGRAAFDLMVAEAAVLPGFECRPARHDETRVFLYDDSGAGERPYTFTVNRGDLLFCVRKAGIERVPGGLPALSRQFSTGREDSKGEWTVRITNAADARRLSGLLFGSKFVADTGAQHWWVNHKDTFQQEIDGSYLWSPKTNKNGGRNPSYDNMTRAVPGDVVFSYADGRIGAVGVVIDRVRTAPVPAAVRPPAEQWQSDAGWLLPVRFELLPQPLLPQDHLKRLAPLLPGKLSPIRARGDYNHGLYLAEIPPSMAAVLREILGGQLQEIEERVAIETDDRLTDAAIEERIWLRSDLGPGEKRQLINARVGQGSFRGSVERIEKACRVTGVLDRRHLRATHIKPWKLSDDREKLDGANGLLLSPHIDHLFDRGHISFSDDGRMLISKHLNPTVTKVWGLDKSRPPRPFRPEQRRYLEFHRRHIFEKVTGGRRS